MLFFCEFLLKLYNNNNVDYIKNRICDKWKYMNKMEMN